MLEEQHDRSAFSTNITVLHQSNHAVNVHVLTSEELKILESANEFLHDFVHTLFELIKVEVGVRFHHFGLEPVISKIQLRDELIRKASTYLYLFMYSLRY